MISRKRCCSRTSGAAFVPAAAMAVAIAAPAAQGQGEVLWRSRLDGYSLSRLATIGPDGTVFVSDGGRLYAFTPAGELRWTAEGAGGGRPVSFGADRTIYTGAEFTLAPDAGLVTALNPDGSVKWRFANPRPGLDLAAGPNLGPDGNIYAAQDVDGDPNALGVFSLDSDGNLRWATRTAYPMISLRGPSFSDILFADDRMYITVFRRLSRPPSIQTYDFDGKLMWYSADLALAVGGAPELTPAGSLIVPWAQTGMQSLSPDGDVEWIREHPGDGSLLIGADIAADGTIYAGDWLGPDWWAINPDGSTIWTATPAETIMLQGFTVTPDGAQLIANGTDTFGRPGWIRAYDASDGSQLWSTELPDEGGLHQFAAARPTITADGATAYFATYFAGDSQYGYLYAVALGDSCPADCDQSGSLDLFDFLCFQSLFATGAPGADCDGDGALTFFDFLCFQNLFAAGCS